ELGPLRGDERELLFLLDRDAVALLERLAVRAQRPARDLEPRRPVRPEVDGELARGVRPRDLEARVLPDRDRAVLAVRRGDEAEPARLQSAGEALLRVARPRALLVRLDPDLEEVDGLLLRGVVLAVRDARARGHVLELARADHGAVPHAVLVLERALEHPGQDL